MHWRKPIGQMRAQTEWEQEEGSRRPVPQAGPPLAGGHWAHRGEQAGGQDATRRERAQPPPP